MKARLGAGAIAGVALGAAAWSPCLTVRAAGTVGALATPTNLTGAATLAPLFAKLAELDAKTAAADVRVVQLGDSHTASDYGVSVLRRALQERFGDGGRGFLPLGAPYKRLFQAGELMADGEGFDPREGGKRKAEGDGFFGPTGIAMVTTQAGAHMTSRIAASPTTLSVAYLQQPSGGTFDLLLDGARLATVETKGERKVSARTVEVPAAEASRGEHRVEIRARGNGEARLFGMDLDVPAKGVVVDALGINGAKMSTRLDDDETAFAQALQILHPSLVVLAYGTNEAGDGTTPEAHEGHATEMVARLRRAVPNVPCLLLGPPDRASSSGGTWTTMPRLVEMVEVQRRVAGKVGCAFFDQLAAMGGPGTIHAWAGEAKARARKDHVHLTRDGYGVLATALARDLVTAYEASRSSRPSPR